nr:hypothetical protein [Tanacetum cinerariifolium]
MLSFYKPKPGASICAFILEMKGYFDRLESLNMVFDVELSINIILSGLPADYNQFVLSYQMNEKETSIMELHSLLQTVEQGIKKINVPFTSAAPVLTGLKESRRLKHGELNLVMGNRKITPVIKIGKYELMLKSGIMIDLNNCCYSSEMTRNIILFHALFKNGYKFSFDNENGDILVYSNGCFMFKASLCKGIYETVECISHNGNVILNVGSYNELDKLKLWHSRLGHINKKRFAQLQKDRVLESFDFKSDDACESCLLGKMTKSPFIGSCEREDGRSKMDIEEIQEPADEEPIVNTNTQPEVVTPIKPDDISLPIRKTSSRVNKPPQFYYGFHIEEDKISDSILSKLDEPVNYKEAMASLEAAK